MNIVCTGAGKFIEIQGTAERRPFSREDLNKLLDLAQTGIRELCRRQREAVERART